MAGTGGKRTNAGRKPKVDEEKVNSIFINALKELYKTTSDDNAKTTFVKQVLMESQRGQIFIAEHIFGKPKETIEQTTNISSINIKDLFSIDKIK
jgi:hypothetical protein